MEDKNSDLVHSLSNQVTYVKKLNTVTGINFEAIANLTTVIKDNLVHSHEMFQNINKDSMASFYGTWTECPICSD